MFGMESEEVSENYASLICEEQRENRLTKFPVVWAIEMLLSSQLVFWS